MTTTTAAQQVDETEFTVSAVVTQMANGTLIDTDGDGALVYVDTVEEDGTACEAFTVTAGGARNLAQALTVAAAKLDGWAGR